MDLSWLQIKVTHDPQPSALLIRATRIICGVTNVAISKHILTEYSYHTSAQLVTVVYYDKGYTTM